MFNNISFLPCRSMGMISGFNKKKYIDNKNEIKKSYDVIRAVINQSCYHDRYNAPKVLDSHIEDFISKVQESTQISFKKQLDQSLVFNPSKSPNSQTILNIVLDKTDKEIIDMLDKRDETVSTCFGEFKSKNNIQCQSYLKQRLTFLKKLVEKYPIIKEKNNLVKTVTDTMNSYLD